VLVGRTKGSVEGYDLLVKWIGIAHRYVEEYGIPQLPSKDREEFEKVSVEVKPLLDRLNKATRDLLIPALADGQSGLVFDAKLTSQQFIKALPPTPQTLPMLEPAIVVGVTDAAKLKQAFEEYYAVADAFVEILKGLKKSEIPKDFKIPRPRVYNIRRGTAYGYRLPVQWGVDTHVLPNAGLSENVAVLSLSARHTLRLLDDKAPMIAGIALATDRPLAAAGGLDFGALVEAVTPWADLALDNGTARLAPQMADMVRLHAKAALEVLRVYRGSVFETYVEDKVTVTHSRSEFHDIED
jgi:hypothetical protein